MKVIHLISGGDSGGAKTHVLSLLKYLNETITAQLVCFRDGPFAEEARSLNIPTKIMGGNHILKICRELAEYIRREGYQLIHCHGARANMIGVLLQKSTGLPVVTTVHSDYKIDYLGRPLDRFYAIYNGIDFTPAPDQGDRVPYLRDLGVRMEEDSVVVGIAARLNPVKDMSTLIRGFAIAYKTCNKLRLVIAGDGEEREKLAALARELGVERYVTFAGWISGGMDRFYSALDINVLTSLSETFSYALTEGARFHLATISTAVGGIPYLLDHGVNGYLFQPRDFEALGKYLGTLGNDGGLRREMGERLYEKASSQFSIEKTVDTQLHIYREILRRHSRPRSERDGVVICGAYGRGNAGDDAILEAILQEMRSLDPDMPVTVISKNPMGTRRTYRVQAVSRVDVPGWRRAMKRAKLYINGGGSLIQDVTSRRSLWFYLMNIRAAKQAGCRVQMYGCGIGPVTRENHRKLAAKVLNRNVDAITLREPDSLEELKSMGVDRPDIRLTADPALTLAPAPEEKTDSVLLQAGIPPRGDYICFALRPWPGFQEKAPLFGAAARYAWERYGLTPVFTAVEKGQDPGAARLAAQSLGEVPHYFLDDAGAAGTIIGALSRMKIVLSMRLHALIFAAGQGIPLGGVVYDPKVSAFLRYIGQENFADLEALTLETLSAMIDRAVAQAGDKQAQAEAVRRLRALERGNVDTASLFLKEKREKER